VKFNDQIGGKTMKQSWVVLMLPLVGILLPLALGHADDAGTTPDGHRLVTPGEIKWMDAPSSIPPGAKAAILEGDPTKEGPFTLRLRVPDGYRVPPHWHSKAEHITVLSGTFYLGTGERFDRERGRALRAGSFAVMPAQMRHFAWMKGETIVQVHGMGPFEITYVNPADDPRTRKQ
jgi:anti-sigma factor ChrR (cupin superfamily)